MRKPQYYYDLYKQAPLQGKIFYLLILLALILSVVTSAANIFLQLGWPIILTTLFLGIFCLFILIITLKTTNYIRSAYITFWMLLLLIYPALWFFNGGTSGPTLSVYIFNTFLTSILFDKAKTKALLTVQFVTLALLLYIEYTMPELITPYATTQIRFIDTSYLHTSSKKVV